MCADVNKGPERAGPERKARARDMEEEAEEVYPLRLTLVKAAHQPVKTSVCHAAGCRDQTSSSQMTVLQPFHTSVQSLVSAFLSEDLMVLGPPVGRIP